MTLRTRALVSLLTIGTPLAAQDGPPLPALAPCDGSYRVDMGPVLMTSDGMVVPGRGPETQGIATIETRACGREFSLTLNGQLRFLQSVMDERTYVADLPPQDGATGTMTVTLAYPGAMSGEMKVSDPDITVTRTLNITPVEVSMPDLEGCFDDPAPATGEHAVTPGEWPLQDAMSARGLNPPSEFGFGDYTRGSGSSDSFSYRADIFLSAGGDILPRQQGQGTLQELMCGATDELEPPRFMLEAKINEVEGSTFVFVRVIEIETGKIMEQREAVVDSVDPIRIADAIGDAWDQLNWQTGPMTNGKAMQAQ